MNWQWAAEVASDFTPGAAGIWFVALMMAGWFMREWRETRKMTDTDKLARRDGYAYQVQMLMDENRLLAADQKALREEYKRDRKECQEETDGLRQEIIRLRSLIEEYRHKFSILSSMMAQFNPTDEMTQILVQLDRIEAHHNHGDFKQG